MLRVARCSVAGICLVGIASWSAIGAAEPARRDADPPVPASRAHASDRAAAPVPVVALPAALGPATVAAMVADHGLVGALLDPRLPRSDGRHRGDARTLQPISDHDLGLGWILELAPKLAASSCPNCSAPAGTP